MLEDARAKTALRRFDSGWLLAAEDSSIKTMLGNFAKTDAFLYKRAGGGQ